MRSMTSNLTAYITIIIICQYCCIDKYDKWINVTSKSNLKKLKPANFAVFYIKAISDKLDSHNNGLWVS